VPIKPENRHRYPADWKAIRNRILERAGHHCERCGKPNGVRLFVLPNGVWWDSAYYTWRDNCGRWLGPEHPDQDNDRFTRVVLTIAHWPDPTPENCADENLWALCQACHLRIDMDVHVANRAASRSAERERHQPALALEAA
jgi:5-methylcytosine-specific restriction endonuclease McrA